MGGGHSQEHEAVFVSDLFGVAQKSGLMPDICIDDSLMKFSGLNSAAVLQDYSSQLLTDLAGKAPDYVRSLGTALATLNAVPNAVGLGALVISLILDLAVSSKAAQDSTSTLNMLRRVFAEEKASGVRDSMDEYMKRLSMHINDTLKAQEETERLEKELSYQLTRLRNSMLNDDQMNSRAMKYWINGAAFHSQMLVHAARLKMARSSLVHETDLENCKRTISKAVSIYQHDLQELLKRYKTYKHKTIELSKVASTCVAYYSAVSCVYDHCAVRDSEFRFVSSIKHKTISNNYCDWSRDAYVDYMFNNWHILKQVNKYFFDLHKNLKELILQRKTFSI